MGVRLSGERYSGGPATEIADGAQLLGGVEFSPGGQLTHLGNRVYSTGDWSTFWKGLTVRGGAMVLSAAVPLKVKHLRTGGLVADATINFISAAVVTLPASDGELRRIVNERADTITVEDDAGTVIATIPVNSGRWFLGSGSTWLDLGFG